MDAVFADTADVYTSKPGSITCNQEQLLTTLHTAVNRATQSGHSVLASFVQLLGEWNAIDLFTASTRADIGECFFWERPAEGSAFIGIGTATAITTTGSTYITAAIAEWRALLQQAVINYTQEDREAWQPQGSYTCPPDRMLHFQHAGPLFFGGFCFDPLSPRTKLWQGFPDGLLVLPRFLLSCNAVCTALTINVLVQADEDIEHCAQAIMESVLHLRAATKAPTPPNSITSPPERVLAPTRVEKLSIQTQQSTTGVSSPLCLHDLRPASEWMELVAQTAQSIQHGDYEKVVLARGVEVTSQTPEKTFDVSAILCQLRQNYPGAYIFAMQRGERYFVGATPERLVCSQDGQIQTIALAGSAPRGATLEEDTQLGAELLHSTKNKGEHEIVVKMVREALATLCTKVWVADAPHLLKLKNVQHLETPIVGKLLPGHCVLEAIAALHPTPAVGGFPRQLALEAIRTGEQLDRGWYAGPLGWLDANGNGEFAVALRSALIESNKATLFAGCGIVADSDPQSEYAESCLKLQVILRGLGNCAEED